MVTLLLGHKLCASSALLGLQIFLRNIQLYGATSHM